MRPALATALAATLLGCASAPTARQKEAAEIHTNLGTEALRAGRHQEALREFDDALKSDESLPEAHLGRGLVMEYAFGRRDEAEKEYRKAIDLRPGMSEAHNNLGQLLAARGRLEEAVSEFDAALANMYYREPFAARFNKGRVLNELGRRDEALAELKTCLTLNPRFCPCHREAGRILLDAGKAREALAAFQKLTSFCEKDPDAWYQAGLAHLKLGEADGAREAFGRCTELGGPSDLATECRNRREALR